MSKAQELGRAYIDAVNDKDIDTLLGFFAADGVLEHPFGTFQGPEKIAEFYTGIVFHADTVVTAGSSCGDDLMAALELVGVSPQAPDQPQLACDIFQLNEAGKITSLRVYYLNSAGG